MLAPSAAAFTELPTRLKRGECRDGEGGRREEGERERERESEGGGGLSHIDRKEKKDTPDLEPDPLG